MKKNMFHNLVWLLLAGTLCFFCLTNCEKEVLLKPADSDMTVGERGVSRIFKGEMTLYSVYRNVDENGIFRESYTGDGLFTHLGRTSVTLDQTIAQVIHAEITFTAANGDELYMTVTGPFPTFDPENLTFTSATTYEITGGTGRFIGATGSGCGFGTGSFSAPPPDLSGLVTVRVEVEGDIVYGNGSQGSMKSPVGFVN